MGAETNATKAVSTPPGAGPGAPPPRRARRPLRWVLRGLALSAGGLVLGGAALCFLAGQLDQPAIKSRLLAFVKGRTGFELDYDGLQLSLLHGLSARELRVLTPARFATQADTFVRIADLDLELQPWALLRGELHLTALRASQFELAVVRDESGATTLSELFPPTREPETKPAAPLSRALADLPHVTLEQLAVGGIGVRLVELQNSGPPRVVQLSGLALSGSVRSGAAGLAGTQLGLQGTPLRAELSGGARVRHAELPLELNLHGEGAQSIAFDGHAALGEQDLTPSWAWPSELLELAGSLRFDDGASKTSLLLERLRALGGALSVVGQTDVFDGEPLRSVSSGKVALHLEALPVELPLSLAGLELELEARELAWDGQAVAGSLSARGGARSLELRLPDAQLRLQAAALSGTGVFAAAGGSLHGKLSADALSAGADDAEIEVGALELVLDGATSAQPSVQPITANAALAVRSLQVRAAAGTSIALDRMTLSANARDLARDSAAPFGVRGSAELALSVPALSVFSGSAAPVPVGPAALRARRTSAAIQGLELHAAAPLSLASASGTLAALALKAPAGALRDLKLELAAQDLLAWSAEHAGSPAATLTGSIGRLEASGSRAALEALRVSASRPSLEHYQLELSATGAALSARGVPVPGRIQAEARADAAPAAGTLQLNTTLAGEGGAAVDLDLDLGFDRDTERLSYQAALSAEKLGAFVAFVSRLAPGAAPLSLARTRLRASARGELAGVLHAGEGALPVLAERPLAAARGSQGLELELQGVGYRTASRSLDIPDLSFQLDSVHGAAGAGSLNASVRAPSIELSADGSSVRLEGLNQELHGSFDRAPDQGKIELRSTLALAALEQSWLPGYPMRDVHLSSQLQVERLSSLLLRELRLENTAAGTVLRASGALELRPKGTPARGTIPGRQALALEGRLEQPLAPLEALGVAARARGTLAVPFRIESGGLLAYRLLAALEAHDVSFTDRAHSFTIQGLNGVVPLVEEFVLLPTGPELSPGPSTSPLADPRFFDLHPFLASNDYVTADAITIGKLQTLGPLAANVRIARTDFLIDQLQAGFRGGQIVGRLHTAYRDGDPIVRVRLNATGVRSRDSGDVLDANMALTFVPAAMTLDGKIQLVRASRTHVMDILDVLDPYHELVNANRIRSALALGYPKFVRFQLHDGAVDSKVELGGIAKLVRIDEIRAVPLGPILQRYVAPTMSALLPPRAGALVPPRAGARPAPQALAEPVPGPKKKVSP